MRADLVPQWEGKSTGERKALDRGETEVYSFGEDGEVEGRCL
jgi:hypothetical protein